MAEALPEFFPEFYGVRDGLLFRRWVEERHRVEPPNRLDELDELARQIARYVHARHERLDVEEDLSLRTTGAWHRAAKLLANSFGRLALPSRLVLYRPSGSCTWASPDGSMSLEQWFRLRGRGQGSAHIPEGRLRSAGILEPGHRDRRALPYDQAFDLAGAATVAISSKQPRLEQHFEDRLTAIVALPR